MAVDAQPTSPPGTTIPSPAEATAPPRRRGEQLDCSAGPDCGAPTPALSSVVAPRRGPNDVIAQVMNYSTTQLQQTDAADGGRQYAGESDASNFGSREWKQGMLDLVVTHWVWLISALIAGGLAGSWLIRLQLARVRGSADEARHAVEAKAAEEARRVAETQANEGAHRAADAQAVEDARRAAEAQAVEDARRAAEAQAVEDAPGVSKGNAVEDTRCDAKAKGNKETARVLKATTVAKTKARGVTKAKAAKQAGGGAEAKAAEETPRIAKRSAATIRPGRSPKGPAAQRADMP
jgi:hypothetical protein